MSGKSLLVVDAQRGFTALHPEELPVPGALEIVANINRLLLLPWRRVDASQDWHPPDHCSFHGQRDNLYPPHCVAGTPGADFLPGLRTERFHAIWRKGFHKHRDAYSVVEQHPGLAALLRAEGIEEVVVCGLATNICCLETGRDLRRHGFRVCIVEDASAGIDIPKSSLGQAAAKAEGEKSGIQYRRTAELVAELAPAKSA
jgi:nicotinamidase/pyrazinamidase